MNFLHLKYVVEVSKTKSISKASENLFMAQPNLSKAIKDLEDSLSISIFTRTKKGMELTEQGEEFVRFAEKILREVEEAETSFASKDKTKQEFSLSAPRASYISNAFNNFLMRVEKNNGIEFNYKETNAMRVIKNVSENGFRLGILRYATRHADFYISVLNDKEIKQKEIYEFKYVLLMSKDSKLNTLKEIRMADLKDYIEIMHGDPYVPTLSTKEAKKMEFSGLTDNRIFIYERGSQYEILDKVKDTFIWVSPVPQEILDKYNLVQRVCVDYNKTYKDVLIYKRDYRFTKLDDIFVEELASSKNNVEANL